MSHYTRNYAEFKTREEKDRQAILDIQEYVGRTSQAWEIILVECGKAEALGTAEAFQSINMALGMFVGVEGYPVHALGRKYCPTAYRAWMLSDVGGKPVPLDDQNFPLPYEGDE